MRKVFRIAVFAVLVAIVTSVAFAAGFGTATHLGFTAPISQTSADTQAHFKVFWEAWDIVQREYINRSAIDADKMTRGAVKGMIDSLGDPHTVYIEPQIAKREKQDFGESFGGIGATVGISNSHVTIVAPISGSPAEKAGIWAGDIIARINGEDTSNMSLQDAVDKIRGPNGTTVKLTIIHEGSSSPVDIDVVRGDIPTVSVYSQMLPGSIGLIQISHFSLRTDQEVIDKLREMRKNELKGIIIDLRNNPGGYLHVTVNTASQFLKDGVVCYEEDVNGNRQAWPVKSGGLATDVPVVVLVNKVSASGSEILAGAIQDLGRGVLIGEETYGKGSAQRQYDLSDGSTIAVTVSHWLTPKGRQIEGKGLSPDIEVKMTQEDYQAKGDIQLQRAIDYINNGK